MNATQNTTADLREWVVSIHTDDDTNRYGKQLPGQYTLTAAMRLVAYHSSLERGGLRVTLSRLRRKNT